MRTSNPQEPERGPAVLTLADLLRGHLDGVTSIVEVAGPDLDLKLRLDVEHTADGGIRHSRVDPAAWLSPVTPAAARPGSPGASGNGAGGGCYRR